MSAGDGGNRFAEWWAECARRDPTRFVNDVLVRPSIGPLAAWLLSGLFALVVWLTIHYAPGAVARAGPSPDDAAAIIPVGASYWTIAAVAALTLAAGLQPVAERRSAGVWSNVMSRSHARLPISLRWLFSVIRAALGAMYLLPAIGLSFVDYLLARPVAILAGATLQPFWLRYGFFFLWMAASGISAWLAPAPYGLWGFFAGVGVIIGIVRRWNWVERDREAFFVSRKADPENERIGFGEDLRDEALVAIAFLFLLIPLGLRQVDLIYPETFTTKGFERDSTSVLTWIGFFGAELAKAVPFVDWSEVFHVANGSPIEPNTVLGAQVVFAMRATLDLLMIAAVTQAVQIGSRLAEQKMVFANGKVDILEPFEERARLRAIGVAAIRSELGRVIDQPAIALFPIYSAERLDQIVRGALIGRPAVQALADPAARRGALALATRQRGAEAARPLIIHAALRDPVYENRRFALLIAEESESTALMAVAYARARSAAEDAVADAANLLSGLPAETRALALRAVRGAQGELDQMVVVPAGRFMMGAAEGAEGLSKTERPSREVVIAAPFEIGKYPVMFDEYEAFCDATGHDRTTDSGWGTGRRPVIYVNWHDAIAYIDWLNAWTGDHFRLPSEAEWEYACRAGAITQFCCGDDTAQLEDYAWFEINSDNKTQRVGEKLANAFGIHDMHGLVWEWCADAWTADYEGAPIDGAARQSGDPSLRVLRGGSWYNAAQMLRAGGRHWNDITLRDPRNGFRLARTIWALLCTAPVLHDGAWAKAAMRSPRLRGIPDTTGFLTKSLAQLAHPIVSVGQPIS